MQPAVFEIIHMNTKEIKLVKLKSIEPQERFKQAMDEEGWIIYKIHQNGKV